MFKKVTSLFLAICLLLSFVTPALAGYEDTPITVSAQASGSNNTYQWYICNENGDILSNLGTSVSFILNSAAPGTSYYKAVVTNTQPSKAPTSVTTPPITHIVTEPPAQAETPVIDVQPVSAGYNKGRKPLTLRVSVNPVTDGGSLSYQWYKSSNGILNPTANEKVGIGTNGYSCPTGTVGTAYYYCVITNTNLNAVQQKTSVTSAAAVITINAFDNAEPPNITINIGTATDDQVYLNPTVQLQLTAVSTDEGTISYRWYECEDALMTNAVEIAGATSSTYAPSADEIGTKYYFCRVKNTNIHATTDKERTVDSFVRGVETIGPSYSFTTTGIGAGGGGYVGRVVTEGVQIPLDAGVMEGFVFSGWTSSAGGTIGLASLSNTIFTMPAANVVVTANWKAVRSLKIYLHPEDDNPTVRNCVEGDLIPIHAGASPSHSFAGWQADPEVIIADPSNPNTTVTIGSEDIEVTATWALNNSLTVDLAGGNGSAYSSVYPVGYVVSINAGSRSGYTFAGWTSSNDGTFANAANASTTFTMPDNATTITATWTAVPSRGGGGGGSTSTAPTNTTGTITASTTDGTKTSSNDVKVETKSGRTEITVAKDFMQRTVDKALDESVKESKDATVTLSVTAPSTSNRVAVGIPVPSIDALARSSTNASLTVDTPEGSITFNRDALETTAANAEGATVILELARVEKKDLTDSQKDMVGDRPVVDLTLTSNGRQISKLHGNASVTIPYTPYDGEDTSKLVVWYLEDNGNLTPMECTYADGKVTFVTTHFSVYVVASNKFNDVKISDWFYSSVAKAQEKGLMNGVSSEKFAPQQTTTRAMVTTMLYRLEGNPKSTTSAKYSDIVSDQYYAQAVAWASDTGVVKGISEDIFAPSTNVTREQLVTMLYRYAGSPVISMEYDPDKFSDADEISDYARTAIAWGVKVGIIKGNANGTLNAKGYATRAEVATIFSNFK